MISAAEAWSFYLRTLGKTRNYYKLVFLNSSGTHHTCRTQSKARPVGSTHSTFCGSPTSCSCTLWSASFHLHFCLTQFLYFVDFPTAPIPSTLSYLKSANQRHAIPCSSARTWTWMRMGSSWGSALWLEAVCFRAKLSYGSKSTGIGRHSTGCS